MMFCSINKIIIKISESFKTVNQAVLLTSNKYEKNVILKQQT